MESKKPLILVSNDDGVMAKGISELVKFLRPLGEIVVMAPDCSALRQRQCIDGDSSGSLSTSQKRSGTDCI